MTKYLLLFPLLLFSQREMPDSLSESATMSLLTMSPGEDLYTAFGHSAIRLVDPEHQIDRIYNYGTFSFTEPGFYVKFTRGLLDYQLSAYHFKYAMMEYTDAERAIISQQLNLTAEQLQRIYAYLETNFLPENRRYRYDFFLDNCATRIRDLYEDVLKDSVRLYYNRERTLSFRSYLDIYTDNFRFSDYGMDLGMGTPSDRIATAGEALFLPDFLYESVELAEIYNEGSWQPFVSKVDTVLWFEHIATKPWSPPWPAILFWTVFSGFAALTALSFRRDAVPMWLRSLDFLLYLVVGLAGLLITFLWFFTNHNVTPNNYDILWAWPTHFIIAFRLLLRARPAWVRIYFKLNVLVMLVTLAGWLFWPQDMHEASIPLILALMIRGWMNSRSQIS